jgi:hypothetical protein
MAIEDPKYRASAAQMLVAEFDGKGLSTDRALVEAGDPKVEGIIAESQMAAQKAGQSNANTQRTKYNADFIQRHIKETRLFGGCKRPRAMLLIKDPVAKYGRYLGGKEATAGPSYIPQLEEPLRARGDGVKKRRV